MSDLKQKVQERLSGADVWALATVTDDGKPWVRYVTPRADKDMTVWCATFAGSRKVPQIAHNPEVHLVVGVRDAASAQAWLQIQGRAVVLSDTASRKAVWNDELSHVFSGPDDPNLTVIKITQYRIEYQIMAPVPPDVLEL